LGGKQGCMAMKERGTNAAICIAGVHGTQEGMHSEPAWGRGRYAQRACMGQRKVCTASLHGEKEGVIHLNFKICAQSLSLTKRLYMKLVFSVVQRA